jgi:transcriptional regulator with XRE-family HTH domain
MPQKPKFKLKKIESDNKTIGERISVARKKKGLTQSELALKIGISQRLVSNYEVDRVKISAEMLGQFAVALGVSADQLLGLVNFEQVPKEISLRFSRRFLEIEKLPETKKKAILNMLDDSIKANF